MGIKFVLTLLLFLVAIGLGAAHLTGNWSGAIRVVSDGDKMTIEFLDGPSVKLNVKIGESFSQSSAIAVQGNY